MSPLERGFRSMQPLGRDVGEFGYSRDAPAAPPTVKTDLYGSIRSPYCQTFEVDRNDCSFAGSRFYQATLNKQSLGSGLAVSRISLSLCWRGLVRAPTYIRNATSPTTLLS